MADRFSPAAAAVDKEIMRGVKRRPASQPGVHELENLGEKEGVTAPTLKVTARQLARHIALYGKEGTEHVVPS